MHEEEESAAPCRRATAGRSGRRPADERGEWRRLAARLAWYLDRLEAAGVASRPEARVFGDAYRLVLPLAGERWWREHPPVRLNARQRRLLDKLRKQRRRIARGARGAESFELALNRAAAIYARGGDQRGVGRCLRLIAAIEEAEAVLG